MKMTRCIVRALIMFCLIVLVHASATADDPEPSSVGIIYRDNIDAVVSVIAYDSNNKPISQGSGFIINSNGRIATNQHVISDASFITVKMHSGASYLAAGISAVDCSADLAVFDLKAEGVRFKYVSLAERPRVEIGDSVVAIGTPLLLESSVSDGIVSGIRTSSDENITYFQTTAPVSSGNSGGPLFDAAGIVIGVISFKFAAGENINFAVSSHSIFEMLPSVPDNPFVIADAFLSEDEYSCRTMEGQADIVPPGSSPVAGTYSGFWQSKHGHSGGVLMTISVDGDSVKGKLAITGSPLGYTGDEFVGRVDKFADGAWTVSLSTNDNKMKATALFAGDDLLGDYSFRYRLFSRDRGTWILQRR